MLQTRQAPAPVPGSANVVPSPQTGERPSPGPTAGTGRGRLVDIVV
jgi:hypothetical protein